MNHICTWLCADEKGQESRFPQTGKLSSSREHQNIYWRCVLVFFITSKRFNSREKHVFFTNVKELPAVDGKKVSTTLSELGVEVVFTDFKYRTPKGYYGAFQNQFYEFSILEYIATTDNKESNQYLILDADCIFIKPVAELFAKAGQTGFISFDDKVSPDYVINGLSRNDLKNLYEILLKKSIPDIPSYHLGEFLLCNVRNIKRIYRDFTELWPVLLERFAAGQQKFNEEAHTLSYLYYKNGLRAESTNRFMKRIWTNPLFYRNVEASDLTLYIWHLPSEKTFGLYRLYETFLHTLPNYGFDLNYQSYITL
ncbi:MAG: hypothetical protein H7Y01_03905, partial [Ferruginibacter sp.]|nr:hypothetical protein [Chitinophagaceae bacterium]